MARPRPITGIDPARRLRPNARRILAVRIDEIWSFDPAVLSPGNVRELHDMRIACKRLRYLLEIFRRAFPTALQPFIEQIGALQDLLGDIHDCDVQIPMLQAHLDRLDQDDRRRAAELVRGAAPTTVAASRRERAYGRFAAQLAADSSRPRHAGVVALITRRSFDRDRLYADFLATWRRMGQEGFRDRLEAAIGLRTS